MISTRSDSREPAWVQPGADPAWRRRISTPSVNRVTLARAESTDDRTASGKQVPARPRNHGGDHDDHASPAHRATPWVGYGEIIARGSVAPRAHRRCERGARPRASRPVDGVAWRADRRIGHRRQRHVDRRLPAHGTDDEGFAPAFVIVRRSTRQQHLRRTLALHLNFEAAPALETLAAAQGLDGGTAIGGAVGGSRAGRAAIDDVAARRVSSGGTGFLGYLLGGVAGTSGNLIDRLGHAADARPDARERIVDPAAYRFEWSTRRRRRRSGGRRLGGRGARLLRGRKRYGGKRQYRSGRECRRHADPDDPRFCLHVGDLNPSAWR